MSPDTAADYSRRIEDDLRGNILPFWIGHVVNPANGGFLGSLKNDLSADSEAERGALLTLSLIHI